MLRHRTSSLCFTLLCATMAALLLALGAPADGAPAGAATFAAAATPAIAPMPVISRAKPAFASSQSSPATSANDSDYSTRWAPSRLPGWLAYDLSSVPAANRTQVVVAWYNDPVTSPYDYKAIADVPYNLPASYTIDVNPAPGATAAPATGWVTLAAVSGNTYHSRQHAINMAGYNWVRMNITASLGGVPMLNLDVHDAGAGASDSWIILGDSITQDGLAHEPITGAGANVSELVNSALPAYFPAVEDGGIGGLTSNEMASGINRWLSVFPGHYVGLAYGTNDANGCASTGTFYNNYVSAVQAVLAAGKIPVIPTIPASTSANVQRCGPAFNAQIQKLYGAFPQIVHGPDLWAFFAADPSLISSDHLHPNAAGYTGLRQQWANAMVGNVYRGSAAPAVALRPTSLGFGSQSVGSTSPSQAVTLTNSGNAALALGAISISGTNASDFGPSSTCPASPATLPAGASCTVSVTFSPSAAGSRTANVSITDDAAGSPHSVALSGTGTASGPTVSLTPGSVAFAAQKLATTSPAQTVTLKNSGTAPLAVTGITLSGTNGADYAQANTCPMSPASLAVNASCAISVTFSPGAPGGRIAALNVADNAPGSPQAVPLTGTGGGASIAFDKTLGKSSQNIGSSTIPLRTSAAALASSRVFAFVNWNDPSATLASLSGGGLTWTVDAQAKDASNNHGAIASANAPSGLVSGTAITATFSKSVTNGLIAAASFTGIAASSPVDVTAGTVQAGGAAWQGSVTTTNSNDLVLGWSGIDANTTDSAAAPNVELYDFGDVDLYEWSTAVYRIESTTGTKSVNGTWANASGSTANVTVLAAYKGA